MQELPFLRSAHRLMFIDICMKFREDSFRGFQVTERTRFVTDRRTDGRTDARGKTICLPTLRGGDIISTKEYAGCTLLVLKRHIKLKFTMYKKLMFFLLPNLLIY